MDGSSKLSADSTSLSVPIMLLLSLREERVSLWRFLFFPPLGLFFLPLCFGVSAVLLEDPVP